MFLVPSDLTCLSLWCLLSSHIKLDQDGRLVLSRDFSGLNPLTRWFALAGRSNLRYEGIRNGSPAFFKPYRKVCKHVLLHVTIFFGEFLIIRWIRSSIQSRCIHLPPNWNPAFLHIPFEALATWVQLALAQRRGRIIGCRNPLHDTSSMPTGIATKTALPEPKSIKT